MPYATRQGTINFPKRKSILTTKLLKTPDVKHTPESKILLATSASSSARKALHSSVSGTIVGREREQKQLTDFFLSHSDSLTSGCIYLSGLPGTGKTATVNYVIEKNELSKKYHIVKINCTACNSSNAIFKLICGELKLKTVKKTEKECISAIEKYLLRKHKMILLILDEIDQLESKSQSVLYKIFEWPSWENSKLVLVGIANAMDLTDRILPRLCMKVELKPILLHFTPYTKVEIAEILKNRLTEAEVDKMFAPGAVELISAKVAGTSGDVRRALDLSKRVIEIAELKNQKQSQDTELNSSTTTPKLLKRKIEESTPSKLESMVNKLVDQVNTPRKYSFESAEASPKKIFKTKESPTKVCLGDITPQKLNLISNCSPKRKIFDNSPKKPRGLGAIDEDDVENSLKKLEANVVSNKTTKALNKTAKEVVLRKSPRKLHLIKTDEEEVVLRNSPRKLQLIKTEEEEVVVRRSPRKLQFDVDSKDVLSVMKNVFGTSKSFNLSGESSFPLHQKLLICSLLLIIKKGKKKDVNVGRLHQVYSKVCAKRGLTAVDKSGFLFLCRQVEVTGVLQIGKGPGTLAKVTIRWDEAEVENSLKDLNLLSSILNDASCLA